MSVPDDSRVAVVLLPALPDGRAALPAELRRWLGRAGVSPPQAAVDPLSRLLEALQLPPPETCLGAFRMWGQTGERPSIWVAAIDPVYLEPQLDHLRLHAFEPGQLQAAELRGIFDQLQATLTAGRPLGFARIGHYAYLRSDESMASARLPAAQLQGACPDAHLPAGKAAAGFRNLLSEIEMSLHEHPVNLQRAEAGLVPVNSLWLWGGGKAPPVQAAALPPLYGADALLRGYWFSRAASVAEWPGSASACIEASSGSCVMLPPAASGDAEWLNRCLADLRRALNSGRLQRLTLLFHDGHRADLRRSDRWRFWRRQEIGFV